MSCSECHNIVGRNYRMVGMVTCSYCETKIDSCGMVGTYLGKYNERHIYRIHPSSYCLGCEAFLNYIHNPCKESGYEEELAKLFGINEYMEA